MRTSTQLPYARGFTLIELVVAMIIISILAAFGITNYQKVRVHAQAAALSHDLHLVEDALIEAYIAGAYEGSSPPTNLDEFAQVWPGGGVSVRLPDGVDLRFSAASGGTSVVVILRWDARHRAIIDALREMRPTTAQGGGTIVLEGIDLDQLAVKTRGA